MSEGEQLDVNLALLAKAVIVGFLTGALFTWLKLPPPIPQSVEGMAGIAGLCIGFVTVVLLRR
jgi:XapX domain-containing protein